MVGGRFINATDADGTGLDRSAVLFMGLRIAEIEQINAICGAAARIVAGASGGGSSGHDPSRLSVEAAAHRGAAILCCRGAGVQLFR